MNARPILTRRWRFLPAVARCGFLLANALWTSNAVGLSGPPELRGWVADAATGVPIEGLRATVTAQPPLVFDRRARVTSMFGFFRVPDLTNGVYAVRLEHPGYEVLSGLIAIAEGQTVRRRFALTPKPAPVPGEPAPFDVFAQVQCAATGWGLAGVPVTVQRFLGATDVLPAEVRTELTEANGAATFRGLSRGHYRFLANQPGPEAGRPGWLPYTTDGTGDDKRLIEEPQAASYFLKPVAQELDVLITGWDPVAQRIGPLGESIVELTGFALGNPDLLLSPVRTGVTDAEGRLKFIGLSAIHWQVVVKRPGYALKTQDILPDANERLPSGSVEIFVPLLPTSLKVTLVAEGYDPAKTKLLYNVPLHLEGIGGTATEGIERRVLPFTSFSSERRTVFSLLPGPYRVWVEGTATTNTFFAVKPWFLGEDQIQLEAGVENQVTLRLGAKPARVRGRLWVADALSPEPVLDPRTGGSELLPIYELRSQSGVEWVGYAGDGLLDEASHAVVQDVDGTGTFAVALLPARYGIRIPAMPNHWGSHVMVRDLATGAVREQGWPFAEVWPYRFAPPRNGTRNDGLPLVFESGHEYELEIYVRRQEVLMRGVVGMASYRPTMAQVLATPENSATADPVIGGEQEIVTEGGTATLMGTAVRTDLLRIAEGVGGLAAAVEFEFRGVGSGDYTLGLAAPRHQFIQRIGGQESPVPLPVRVSSWAPPGVLPPEDPTQYGFVEPLTVLEVVGLEARYQAPNTRLRLRIHVWDGAWTKTYRIVREYEDGDRRISMVAPDYAGGRLFALPHYWVGHFDPHSLGAPVPLPQGGFTFWLHWRSPQRWYEGRVSGEGDHVFDIYEFGPQDNLTATLPELAYNLTLASVNVADRAFPVPGTTIQFWDGTSHVPLELSGQTLEGVRRRVGGGTALNPNWRLVRWDYEVLDPAIPHLRSTALMERGLAVRGQVHRAGAGLAVPNAQVQVRTRFGSLLQEVSTDADGAFALPSALSRAQALFLEVQHPDYLPWRQRFDTADFAAGQAEDWAIVARAELEPVPSPEILETTLDRAGVFLPGARRAGSGADYIAENARAALTLGWSVRVRPASFAYALPKFDLADGNPGGTEAVTVTDGLAEVWLIDPRSYTNRWTGEPTALEPPTGASPAALRSWLTSLGTAQVPGVLHRVVRSFPSPDAEREVAVTGQLDLSQLPAGPFRPLFVVVTRHGGVTVHRHEYPSARRQLVGVTPPPWMASAFEAMSRLTAAQPGSVDPYAMAGRLMPLARFQAAIGATEDGFLNYEYQLGVGVRDGIELGGDWSLVLMPRLAGVFYEGKVEFGLHGQEGEMFVLESEAKDAKAAPVEMMKLVAPKMVEDWVSLDFGQHATLATLSRVAFDAGQPYEFELASKSAADSEFTLSANLGPVLALIPPPVGPTLATLDKADLLQFFIDVGGSSGHRRTTHWQTVFPPARPETTPDPQPHVLRRHFLGGFEDLPLQQDQLELCFRFECGLGVQAFKGVVGAKASLGMAGTHICASKESALFTPNPDGDWPVISRMQGDIRSTLSAWLDVWPGRSPPRQRFGSSSSRMRRSLCLPHNTSTRASSSSWCRETQGAAIVCRPRPTWRRGRTGPP